MLVENNQGASLTGKISGPNQSHNRTLQRIELGLVRQMNIEQERIDFEADYCNVHGRVETTWNTDCVKSVENIAFGCT